ncbi:MAG: AzlD domain-containing protein [Clostridia bacterium]|nr:AzlD domain-containing protein [Clostridia bacterium]
MKTNIYICVAVMAAVTYFIRALPLVAIRGRIKSRFFKSFLHYVPFVTLAVMVFPGVLSSTGGFISALIGFLVAVAVSLLGASLPIVSILSVISVFITELFI